MLEERIARMQAAYPSLAAKWPHLTLVDLRYPNGFALRAEGLRLSDEPGGQAAALHAQHSRPTGRTTSAPSARQRV
jgi:hypothetical protein